MMNIDSDFSGTDVSSCETFFMTRYDKIYHKQGIIEMTMPYLEARELLLGFAKSKLVK